MHACIAVLTSMALASGAACSGDEPEPAELELETTLGAAAERCIPTTGSGQFGDRGIRITGGTAGQGQDCDLAKAKNEANFRYADRNCVRKFDPGCPIDCDECSEREPCQTVVGLDEQVRTIPETADQGMTCEEVDDSSCPDGRAHRCTLDGTGKTFYCSCFCRP